METGGTVDDTVACSTALNCERMVLAHAPGITSAGTVAAAIAGVLGTGGDPALPINGVQLSGTDISADRFSDTDINALILGGVTPVETVNGRAEIVRAVTTRTNTDGETDATWRELTTVLVVDDVVPAVRSALRLGFTRAKNSQRTRGAIRTQAMIVLEEKLKKEIIDSYDNVSAEADNSDPTICVVGFDFAVAHGLNRVRLTATINV